LAPRRAEMVELAKYSPENLEVECYEVNEVPLPVGS
jgi:hypothetical protein